MKLFDIFHVNWSMAKVVQVLINLLSRKLYWRFHVSNV